MRPLTFLKMMRPLLPILLGLAVLPASALTSESIPIEQGRTAGPARSVPVSPLSVAAFEQYQRETVAMLTRDEQRHRTHAATQGVEISSRQYAEALRALTSAQLVSEDDWRAQMQGVWAPCAKTDACTAIVNDGRRRTTVTLVRASAIPNATSREVHATQLRELLEHEFGHILLMAVGYQGNQEAFITERWTLGAPGASLASHEQCTLSWC